jgi:thioredoxin 1
MTAHSVSKGLSLLLLALLLTFSEATHAQNAVKESSRSDKNALPHLDSAGVAKALSGSGKFTMIEFGGRRCVPCKEMQPILSRIHAKYATVIDIYNVYMEDDPDIGDRFRVNLIPTQVIFNQRGKEIKRHVGLWKEEEIEAQYKKLGIVK